MIMKKNSLENMRKKEKVMGDNVDDEKRNI